MRLLQACKGFVGRSRLSDQVKRFYQEFLGGDIRAVRRVMHDSQTDLAGEQPVLQIAAEAFPETQFNVRKTRCDAAQLGRRDEFARGLVQRFRSGQKLRI